MGMMVGQAFALEMGAVAWNFAGPWNLGADKVLDGYWLSQLI